MSAPHDPPINIGVDLAHDGAHALSDFAKAIEDCGGTVIRYVRVGPAGGNPHFTIRFERLGKAFFYLRDLYGSEGAVRRLNEARANEALQALR